MSTINIDDLFDEPPPRRGRPTKEEVARRAAAAARLARSPVPPKAAFMQPVGISFLAEITKKQPRQIEKRLSKCPVVEYVSVSGKQQPRYDLMTAMAYLVPPKGDIEDWFAQQNQASLPPQVSKAYWDSMNGRIRAMEKARQLWHTDDVMLVLGRVLMLIKGESQSWVESLPGKDYLSNEQYNTIVDKINELNLSVQKALVDNPEQFRATSMAQTLLDEIDEAARGTYDEAAED